MTEPKSVPFPWKIITTKNGLDAVRCNKRASIRTWLIASAIPGIVFGACSGETGLFNMPGVIAIVPFGLSIIWCLLDLFYPCIFSEDEMHPVIMLVGECNVLLVLVLWTVAWAVALADSNYHYRRHIIVRTYATLPQAVSIVLHLYLVIKLFCVELPKLFPIRCGGGRVTCPACQYKWTQSRQDRREVDADDEDLIAPPRRDDATGSGNNTPKSTQDRSEQDAADQV